MTFQVITTVLMALLSWVFLKVSFKMHKHKSLAMQITGVPVMLAGYAFAGGVLLGLCGIFVLAMGWATVS